MKRLILLAFALWFATPDRVTDLMCMVECQRKGYTYGYCERFCSY